MSGVYEWVRNIVFFYILIAVVMNVLPSNQYKKYIQFFTGLVMVLVIASPVLRWFQLDRPFEEFFKIADIKGEWNSMQQIEAGFDGLYTQEWQKGYELELEKQIEAIVLVHGLYPKGVTVLLEKSAKGGFVIQGVEILASRKEGEGKQIIVEQINPKDKRVDSVEELNIKSDLEEVYNISASNINIEIQR